MRKKSNAHQGMRENSLFVKAAVFMKYHSLRFAISNYRGRAFALMKHPIAPDKLLTHKYFSNLCDRYAESVENLDERKLIECAKEICEQPVLKITEKLLQIEEANPCDYLSFKPYYFLDERCPLKRSSSKPVLRDGVANPFLAARSDKPRLAQLCARLHALALANAVAPNAAYVSYAYRQLESWFINEKTMMTPHMERAQVMPWSGRRRGHGIIDSRWFILLIDALVLFKSRNCDLPYGDVFNWLQRFCHWLLTSRSGLAEVVFTNNRGSWLDALVSYIALAIDREEVAREIVRFSLRKRPNQQIDFRGMQPLELKRFTAISYSLYNMYPLFYLAEIHPFIRGDKFDNEKIQLIRDSLPQLRGMISENERGKIEDIDFILTYDLNLYYPYSFAQIQSFPAVLPFFKAC